MMNRNFVLGFILIFILIGCINNNDEVFIKKVFPLDTPDLISKPEYDLINQLLEGQILQQRTNLHLYHNYNVIKQNIPEFDSLVYVDYLSSNSEEYYLDSTEVEVGSIKLISNNEVEYLLYNPEFDNWEEFYKYYPENHGLSSVSRVGFNQDTTLAMICYGFDDRYSLLNVVYYCKKVDGNWEIIGKLGIITMVSG